MPLQRVPVEVTSDINVTPLVDVMLVLLIIFMVITPLLQKGLNVELAPTRNPVEMPDASKEDAIVLGINRDGKIFLGNKLTTADEITAKVKDLLTNKLDKTVFIKADARARFAAVVSVVDAVRSAGVDNVAMLTEQVDQHGNIVSQMSSGGGGGGR